MICLGVKIQTKDNIIYLFFNIEVRKMYQNHLRVTHLALNEKLLQLFCFNCFFFFLLY